VRPPSAGLERTRAGLHARRAPVRTGACTHPRPQPVAGCLPPGIWAPPGSGLRCRPCPTSSSRLSCTPHDVECTVSRPSTPPWVPHLLPAAAGHRASRGHHHRSAAPAPPEVTLTALVPVGREALVRWEHPTRGLHPPASSSPSPRTQAWSTNSTRNGVPGCRRPRPAGPRPEPGLHPVRHGGHGGHRAVLPRPRP